jgi:GTP-binding protein
VNHTFELFDKLGASEEQLDFPVVYASALQGWAVTDLKEAPRLPANARVDGSMKPLFETILARVPPPADDDVEGALQLRIHSLDYSSYVGRIGVGKVRRGRLHPGDEVAVMLGDDFVTKAKVNQVLGFQGLERAPQDEALAGDIVLVTGIDELAIGSTIADLEKPEGLPPLKVDEPTLTMNFQVNTSPFAGQEGKYVTSRQLRERLHKELLTNMALRVEETGDTDVFLVSGRGELHLTILIENMRREGYEVAVGRPRVINKTIDGVESEPYELLTMDVEETHQGAAMEALGYRKGELVDMVPDGHGRVRLDYRVPARGLIGFQGEFMNLTRGTGLMSHVFDDYGPLKGEIPGRRNGVLVSQEDGTVVAFALFNLQERGRLFVIPGDRVYEGMVVGIHSRDNDLVVNPIKEKKLTNIRAAGKDENILLTPPVKLTLEFAVEFVDDDELAEVTPQSIRIRKRFLKEHERKRAAREPVPAA